MHSLQNLLRHPPNPPPPKKKVGWGDKKGTEKKAPHINLQSQSPVSQLGTTLYILELHTQRAQNKKVHLLMGTTTSTNGHNYIY